ncbi:MAG: sulfite exporter TauE/SafE family protein [Leptolyngbyaceae bacterium]|nr:sulfite exporter TauE/SafE family protein [Leptolyngbyaceae bacterium]
MVIPDNWPWLLSGGIVSGILAGLLGIGGGTILVPILVALGIQAVPAVATSSLAILITSISGSVQNWRMGQLDLKRVIYLGFPALLTAQLGVYLAEQVKSKPYILLGLFGVLLLVNIYLVDLKQRLTAQLNQNLNNPDRKPERTFNPVLSKLVTGSLAGVLAGFFGVGGGVIMVPLQLLLLKEPIKLAIQTSLGVVMITAISACIGHGLRGNVLVIQGMILGAGGLLGTQLSTRLLPKLPDPVVSLMFRAFLSLLSIYTFWQAWEKYWAVGG